MERIRVDASRSYDVLVGEGVVSQLGERAASLIGGRRCAIIADDITDSLFGNAAEASLSEHGFSTWRYVIPNGEASKSTENYIALLEFLAETGLCRDDCIVALGGGVVGDLTGFVASSYLRGISFIQVPTTLLSAVDSSVGGKTAINLRAGKNLAGAFCQPVLVLCDTDILRALPEEIFADGMAEVIKYGALGSEKVLDLCTDGAHENLDLLVAECIRMKRDIVAVDEFETGPRKLLNLGHTPAHGIEKLSGYMIPHGKAVAIGMCMMARAAEKMGECETGVSDELVRLCERYGLPVKTDFSPKEIAICAMNDKKRVANDITLVLPKKRGLSELKKFSVGELEKIFASGTEE